MTIAPVEPGGFRALRVGTVATVVQPPAVARPSEQARRREGIRTRGFDGGRGWHGPNWGGRAFP